MATKLYRLKYQVKVGESVFGDSILVPAASAKAARAFFILITGKSLGIMANHSKERILLPLGENPVEIVECRET